MWTKNPISNDSSIESSYPETVSDRQTISEKQILKDIRSESHNIEDLIHKGFLFNRRFLVFIFLLLTTFSGIRQLIMIYNSNIIYYYHYHITKNIYNFIVIIIIISCYCWHGISSSL